MVHRCPFLEELLRIGQALELLKWGKVHVVLLPDLSLLIHRLRGKPTWAMEVQVGIERLLVE